jgi:hypothetical protein
VLLLVLPKMDHHQDVQHCWEMEEDVKDLHQDLDYVVLNIVRIILQQQQIQHVIHS